MKTRYMISFLGMGYKNESRYFENLNHPNAASFDTKYELLAAKNFFNVSTIFVICATQESRKTFQTMQNEEQRNTAYRFAQYDETDEQANIIQCDMDNNQSLFEVIEKIVSKHKSVEWIFNITLGFRHIMFEAASVLSYLAVVQPDVRILRTIYAEVIDSTTVVKSNQDQRKEFGYTDLARQTSYAQWTRATDMFIRYGQADLLSTRLEIFKQEQSHLASLIDNLDKNITGVADALHTANTRRLGQCAADLQKNINDMKRQAMGSGPLFTLLDRVAGEYAVFIPKNDSYQAEIVRQRQVIKWYITKRNWALAIQLAAEHLILLKQIADQNISISDPYRTRNLAGKVWYGWIFTNDQRKFIDIEKIYEKHVDTIKKKHIDTATKAYQQAHMQPFRIWEDKTFKYEYWQDFQAGKLGRAQCDAVRELLNAVGDENALKQLGYDKITESIKAVYNQHKSELKKVKELDVDDCRDIMIALADGTNPDVNKDLLTELRKDNQLVQDCKVIKGATPIGANIRTARNGMAHIDGGTSPDDIQKMCEQVCKMSEQSYP